MILDSRKILEDLERLEKGEIVENSRWTKKEILAPEQVVEHIRKQMRLGFYSYEIEDAPKIDKLEASDILKSMLLEEINDLDCADLCGAPWARVKLRYLKAVYNNFDKWWNNE